VDIHDGGDFGRAATRLGVRAQDLEGLEWLMSHDLQQAIQPFAALVRCYRVDASWLLTGVDNFDAAGMSDDDRLYVADLMVRVANTNFADRSQRRPAWSTAHLAP